MTLPKPYLPNSEQVAVAWVKRYVLPGVISAATSLPKELPADGFIQASSMNARGGNVDIPQIRTPMVTLDFWAPPTAQGRMQWNLAGQLVEQFRRALENQTHMTRLDLGEDYYAAQVQAVYWINEPRRINDDPSGYARFTSDVAVDWVVP